MVPPTWSKGEHHRVIQPVWRQAASDLAEAENIVVMGYSFPESDAFFHHLFAVGSASDVRIKKFLVFDPDTTGDVAVRFRALLGPTAQQRFNSYKYLFSRAVSELPNILAAS
jgi:hypothetical protein